MIVTDYSFDNEDTYIIYLDKVNDYQSKKLIF